MNLLINMVNVQEKAAVNDMGEVTEQATSTAPDEPEPVFESQDKSEKLEDPLFEETIIDGFSFSAFDKYTVLEVSISTGPSEDCL